MKRSVKKLLASLLLLPLLVAGIFLFRGHGASAEPKLEVKFSELDFANLRAEVAERENILSQCGMALTPHVNKAQTILDKYKLKLDDYKKTWGWKEDGEIVRAPVAGLPPGMSTMPGAGSPAVKAQEAAKPPVKPPATPSKDK